MKRLMKKKVKFFKKEVSVFVLVLIGVVGLASAALIPYLSNVITGFVTVSAPMELAFDSGYSNFEQSWSIHGGEEFSFDTYQKNNGEQGIDVFNVILFVKSPEGDIWTGEEFQSVFLEDERYPAGTPGEILPCLYHIKDNGDIINFQNIDSENVNIAKLIFNSEDLEDNGICDGSADPTTYTHAGGHEIVNHITVDTNTHIKPSGEEDSYVMKLFYTDDLTSLGDVEAELFPTTP